MLFTLSLDHHRLKMQLEHAYNYFWIKDSVLELLFHSHPIFWFTLISPVFRTNCYNLLESIDQIFGKNWGEILKTFCSKWVKTLLLSGKWPQGIITFNTIIWIFKLIFDKRSFRKSLINNAIYFKSLWPLIFIFSRLYAWD